MLNRLLMDLASQKRISLPTQLDPKGQFCAQDLAGLSGEEFDACYAKAQLVAHLDAVATFKAESERGLDSEVKALATKALPILKSHLMMIKPIAMKYHEKEMSQESSAGHGQGGGIQRTSGTRGNDR